MFKYLLNILGFMIEYMISAEKEAAEKVRGIFLEQYLNWGAYITNDIPKLNYYNPFFSTTPQSYGLGTETGKIDFLYCNMSEGITGMIDYEISMAGRKKKHKGKLGWRSKKANHGKLPCHGK